MKRYRKKPIITEAVRARIAQKKEEAPTMSEHSKSSWVLLLGALVALTACAEIPTQHVGIVEHFGKVSLDETKGAGLSFFNPWGTGVHDMSGEVIRHEFDKQEAVTRDRQEVSTSVIVLTQMDLSKAATIYSNYRDNLEGSVVIPKSIETIKATTANYDAAQQVQQRARVQADMEKRLRDTLAPFGINLVSLTVTNFRYNDAYQKAIEDTAVAGQNVIKARNELSQTQIEAQKAIAEARGQAQAQQELARGVTTKSLGYLFYQHWDGKLPTVISPGALGTFKIPGLGGD